MRDLQAEEEEQARAQEKLFAEARQKMQVETELSIAESQRKVEAMAEVNGQEVFREPLGQGSGHHRTGLLRL